MKKRICIKLELILVFLLIFTFYNCRLVPCLVDSELSYVTHKPKSEFLIGKYKLHSKISEFEILKNSENAELTIDPNFTFQISKLPIEGWEYGVFQEKENMEIDISGKWKTIQGKNGFFNKENSIFLVDYKVEHYKDNSLGYHGSWKIYQKDGKAVILYSLGDPDSCQAVRFIKSTK